MFVLVKKDKQKVHRTKIIQRKMQADGKTNRQIVEPTTDKQKADKERHKERKLGCQANIDLEQRDRTIQRKEIIFHIGRQHTTLKIIV